MNKMKILGFDVIVEEGAKGGAVATVPRLPGCICQAERNEDVPEAMARLIKTHLLEMASQKPGARLPERPEAGKGRNHPAARKP